MSISTGKGSGVDDIGDGPRIKARLFGGTTALGERLRVSLTVFLHSLIHSRDSFLVNV